MKKSLYAALLSVLTLSAQAQISYIYDGDSFKLGNLDEDLSFHLSLISHDSVDSTLVRWRLIENDFPSSNWADYVCDILCYSPNTRTNDFYIQPLDTFPIQHYIRMWTDQGEGNSTLCFFLPSDSANTVQCKTVYGKTKPVGISEIEGETGLEQNNPNPFRTATSIPYILSSGQGELHIHDLTGRMIQNITLSQNKGQVNFSQNLKAGIYFYSLWENGMMVEGKRMQVID